MKPEECWKTVPGHEGYYEASDLGSVRSLPRTVTFSTGYDRTYPGVLLNPTDDGYGYLVVSLSSPGKRKRDHVHKIVMRTFAGERPRGMLIRHLNGDKTDNRFANLVYGTMSENMKDAVLHGTHPNSRKLMCNRGHILSGENLDNHSLKHGKRVCVACRNARQYAKRHGFSRDGVQEISDRYYGRIMKEVS